MPRAMPAYLRACFLIVDLGFITYWAITGLGVLPDAWLFKDYHDPVLQAWNWSFLPLDLFISATGLGSVYLASRGRRWLPWALLSLGFTSASGLQAISFWAIRGDYDLVWWSFNLLLLLYPMVVLRPLLAQNEE